MGTYRLILAFLVLYSHTFGSIGDINPGVVAVISFFIISGYLMAILIEQNYYGLDKSAGFYLDRAARLFPQYLFYLSLTIILISSFGVDDSLVADRGFIFVVANILILPLGFYMLGLGHALYIPPAWSLGLEVSFYIVFPFYWILPRGAKFGVFLGSFFLFTLAYIGTLNTDWFGYRLLPGTFFVFVLGAFVSSSDRSFLKLVWVVWGTMLVGFSVLFFVPSLLALHFNMEVTLGSVIGIGAILYLKRRPRSKWDDFLGNLSYGVFLSHYLFIFISDRFGVDRTYLVPMGAITSSAITYSLVERPALRLRYRLRQRQDGPKRAPA